MKKIIMACGDGSFNLGDEAVIASFLRNIRLLDKDIEVIVFSCNPEKTKEMHGIKSIKLDMSGFSLLRNLPKMIKKFKKMDLLVWGGGNLVTDAPSQLYTPFHLFKIFLAKIMKKKVAVYAVGVGQVKSRFTKFIVRKVLSKADLITLRDEESKKILEKLGIKNKMYSFVDPAFDLKPAEKNKATKIIKSYGINEKKPMVAFVPRRVFHRKQGSIIPVKYRIKLGLIDDKNKAKFEKLKKTLAMAADYMVETIDANIVFIPMQMLEEQQQQDEKISKEIISMMDHNEKAFVINSYNHKVQELKAVYGLMNLIVGIRFHAIVLGAGMGIPVLSLHYSEKGERLTKKLNLQDYSVPVDDVQYKILKEKIDKIVSDKEKVAKSINKKSEELKKKAKSNVNLIYDMIK
ncbi:MAG: polysaccharide pyruvyl transferase family protein [Candidatus Nanoarchaeia archaeon]|nr:polysaccharide pyruvyl transferase family protein [Candidatus Nanoarchaeia archaeon]